MLGGGRDRSGGEDGNPATEPQEGRLPLISAPYPEHPSGHLCQDGAHLAILRGFSVTSPAAGTC